MTEFAKKTKEKWQSIEIIVFSMSENLDRFKFRIFNKQKNIIQYLGTRPRNIGNEFYMQIECTGTSCIDADGLITEFVLMQCTGLRDRNGKLIYEGDIFEEWYEDENGKKVYEKENLNVIIYQDAMFQVSSNYNTKNQYQSPLIEDEELSYIKKNQIDEVVVGNIFENPELIK